MEPNSWIASSRFMPVLKHAVHDVSRTLCIAGDKLAYMDTFGKRISSAREEAGLSVIAFAEKMKVSRSAVYMWENDETEMNAVNLVVASEILRIRPRWLAIGEGPRGLSETEVIEIEVRPVVKLAMSLPRSVRDHFVLLMQDFAASGVVAGGITVTGENEGKMTHLEQVGDEHERRHNKLGGQKKKSR